MINKIVNCHPLLSSVLFALIGLMVVAQIYLPISILKEISQHYHNNLTSAGLVCSVFGFSYAAGFLISGPLSDRYGRRKIMLVGFSLFFICSLLIKFSSNFNELLIARSLQGLTASSYPPLILAYINETFESKWRVRALSFISLGFLTASIIAQLYSLSLRSLPFNQIVGTLLPLYGIALMVLFYLIQETKDNKQQRKLTDIYKKIPSLLFDTNLRWIYLSTLCTLSVLVAFYIMMDANYAQKFAQANIDPLVTRAVALPAMFLSLLAPKLISKIGGISVLRISFFIASFGLLCAALAVSENSEQGLLIASIIFIGGRAFSVPSLISSIGNYADSDLRGTAISLYTFILFVGASLGPILSHLFAHMPYTYALILLSFIAVIPALLTFFMKGGNSSTQSIKLNISKNKI